MVVLVQRKPLDGVCDILGGESCSVREVRWGSGVVAGNGLVDFKLEQLGLGDKMKRNGMNECE